MSIPTVKLQRDGVIIERSKVDYENNLERFNMRGFKLVTDKVKDVKKTSEDKVVQLKPKKKKAKKKWKI